MKFAARLWWTATTRRAQEAPAFVAAVIVLFLSNGFYVVRGLGDPAVEFPLYLTGLVVVGWLGAVAIPVLFRPDPVLASRRFELLPLTPRRFYLVRLLAGNPLRLLLVASAFFWGLVGRVLLAGPVVLALLEIVQLGAFALLLLALLELAEHRLRRVAASALYIAAVFIVMLLVDGVLFYSVFYRDVVLPILSSLASAPGAALLMGGGGGVGEEIVLTLVVMAVAAGALAGGVRIAPAARERGSGRRLPLRRLAERIPGSFAEAITKELAVLTRAAVGQTGLFVAAMIAGFAFYADIPFLVAGAFLSFLVLSHNPLGPELPYGGDRRYALLPQAASTILAARHLAVVLTVSMVIAVVALAFTLLRGWTMPIGGLLLAWLYGVSLFLFATAVGDRVGRLYPKPIRVRDVILRGGFVTTLSWISLLLVLTAAGAILAGWVVMLGRVVGGLDEVGLVYAALGLASLTYLTAYAGSLQLHRRQPGAILARG